jgi:hypothetical protein
MRGYGGMEGRKEKVNLPHARFDKPERVCDEGRECSSLSGKKKESNSV